MLDLEFSSNAKRFLKKTDSETWDRVIKKIRGLQINPFPRDALKVISKIDKTFRVRVGNYRILYVVLIEKNLLFISNIDKRSRVY